MNKNEKSKRSFLERLKLSVLAFVFVFSLVATVGRPVPAQAQVDPAAIPQRIASFLQDAWQFIREEVLTSLVAVAYKNGIKLFVTDLASQTATWIASGDDGQKPLLFTEDWGTYLETAGQKAAAGAVIDFAEQVGLGDICIAPELAIDVLLPAIEPLGTLEAPRCTLEDIRNTWDVTDPKFLENFTLQFNTNQNDLGIAVSFLTGIESEKEKEEEKAEKEREDSDGFKDATEKVSQLITAPGGLVREKFYQAAVRNDSLPLVFTGDLVADTLDAFTSTLASAYLERLKSGFFTLADFVPGEEDVESLRDRARTSLLDASSTGPTGSEAAEQFQVFKPDITQTVSYNILTEFALCPAEVQFSGLYNCVMDNGFLSAVQGGRPDGFMTVEDAIAEGFLHGDWSFGYTDPGAGIEPSHLNGYAYSNMKKLRRFRIIPVGWEMAAQRSRQLNQRITLQEVVSEFDQEGSPYYRLVDPDWVLKPPVIQCTAKVPGQIAFPTGAGRIQECVDVQDCVAFGPNDECLAYGYCTHEKRRWDFPAQRCEEDFATCDLFLDADDDDSENNLWLSSTLEFEGCSIDTAGCTWYSLVQNAAGEWLTTNKIYLTDSAENCPAEEAGCTEYLRMDNGANLIRNASFEDDGGNDYVLGSGDSTAGNDLPDGWSARQAGISRDNQEALFGEYAVVLQSQAGSDCNPGLQYESPIGSFEVGQVYTISGRTRTNSNSFRNLQLAFENLTFTIPDVGLSWQSFAFNFVMPATSDSYTMVLGSSDGTCSDLNIGVDVMYDGIQLEKGEQASQFKDYGEIPKIYLKDAPACTFEEVGCRQYVPDNKNFGITTTGIATGSDLCPQECVGYMSYEQQGTPIEPSRFVDFIASSAQQCSAEEIGCEEFTNLDVASSGGEGLEYYSSIRHCEQPQPSCATFFTWEGSDTSGFQLMNFSFDTDGTGVPRTIDGSTSCDPDDANCREFIAEDGASYFRDITKLITCSDECVPLRARPGLVDQSQCEERLGQWDTATNRCIFSAIPEQSIQCRVEAVGCREYIGNTGHNVAAIQIAGFEEGSSIDWIGGELSTEATTVGGNSLRIGGTTGTIDADTVRAVPNAEIGASYLVELIAKSSVSDFIDVDVFMGPLNDTSEEYRVGGFVTGTTSWNKYSVGPITLPSGFNPFDTVMTIRATGASSQTSPINVFLDNIVLYKIQDSVYAVKDSWNTPRTCDTDPPLTGGTATRSMVGCQAYKIQGDTTNQRVFLRSFSRLCSEDKVGCQAVLETNNSDAPYREIYQSGDLAEVVVPEDRVTYVVNDSQYACDSRLAGCMELGEPELDENDDVIEFESVFKINDPDTYAETLCPHGALFCKEFRRSDDTLIYAKHPGQKQCEYKQVPFSFPPRNGWFVVGSDEEDPEECLEATDNSYVQRCPSSQISCTAYHEPVTNEFFFYKKNTLASTVNDCNGVVDWKKGCVLFNDLSDRELLFKSGDDEEFIGAPTACQRGDEGCNTNKLYKVRKDRECSQWITGITQSRYWDNNTSQFRTTSYGLGRCIESDPINPTICRRWDNDENKERLTISQYQARNTEWSGEEFSGYSIPNLYPIETLRQRSVGTDEDGNPTGYRLTKLGNAGEACTNTTDCPIGQVCRLSLDAESGGFTGTCYVEDGVNGEGAALASACRGYPEETSPFPSNLATFAPLTDEENPGEIIAKNQFFTNANIGQNGEDVECNYNKVNYGGGEERYYNVETIPPSSILFEGEEQNFRSSSTFLGWDGYCLETDPSRLVNGSDDEFACLTWYPVDVIQGAFDFNNSNVNAGYLVSPDRQYYCAEAILAEYRTTYQFCRRASCKAGYSTTRRGSCAGQEHNRRECNPIGGDGWYPYDGFLHANEQNAGIGVLCLKVARIADSQGNNQAWTTRILGQNLPGSREYFVSDLGWNLTQINEPYGAARPLVPRVEDLNKPLMALDPHNFVEDCEECEYENYGGWKVAESTRPFGICQDEDVDKNGKPCPLAPNAGSPFALNSLGFDLDDETITIRPLNQLPEDEPQPYPQGEDFTEGFDRLSELFARSYGVWEWKSLPSMCVGVCQGGISDGEFCDSASACGTEEPGVTYSCVPNICVGGANDGQSCLDDTECQFELTGDIHQCVEVTGPNVDPDNPEFVCESGPFAGRGCDTLDDCSEDDANGTCSTVNRCQAQLNGNIVLADNSGLACNSAAECNSVGTCAVSRCSSDPVGQDSGLCAGKIAGDLCGSDTVVNRYQQISAGQPSSGWDLVRGNEAVAQRPIVRPVVSDPTRSSGFTEGFNTAITVNGSASGDIEAQGGRAPVTVSFYAYNENGEQMPLRLIIVDWGDGSDAAVSSGSFKNHKHVCRHFCSNAIGIACNADEECQDEDDPEATCQPFNFGDSDQACIEDNEGVNGYFSFSYTYTCEGSTPCTYQPQVLVKDNWGATTRVAYQGNVIIQPAVDEPPLLVP